MEACCAAHLRVLAHNAVVEQVHQALADGEVDVHPESPLQVRLAPLV